MARPNDGKVADNGVFVLNDWGPASALAGTFCAFHPEGSPIVSRHFKANLFNNGLSADGRLAVCQTCNSPDPVDNSLLTVFDLVAGREIASWRPESGWASFYEFPEGGKAVRLGYAGRRAFEYGLDGEFIDREKWIGRELRTGNLSMVERLLKETGSNPPHQLVHRLLSGIDVAMKSTDRKMQAWALKLRGECCEVLARPEEALECYEQALSRDPKIGVKRRAAQLRKAMESSSEP